MVDTFINAIYLYDDKVLITFNYKEGTQTVTFGEATEVASEGNGSDLDCFTAPRKTRTHPCSGFSFLVRREDSNRAAAHSVASKATVRLCLARGSQPVGMSNNRLRFTVRREDSNSNDDDRSQRLKQGGVVGAAF